MIAGDEMTSFEPTPGQPPQPTPSDGALKDVGMGVGGMLSEAALNTTKDQVQRLVDSANAKGFAISEEGANEYLRVFRDFADELQSMQQALANIGQAPQLGDSPYAKTVSNHMQSVATGDQQSFETILKSLQVVVQQARKAFEQAKKNYAEMDDHAAQTFKGLNA